MAYLTGGLTGPQVDPELSDKLTTQGAIFFQSTKDDKLTEFKPGETYAVIYLSAMWEGCKTFFIEFCGTERLSNMIGVVDAKKLLSQQTEAICYVNK